MGIIIIIIKELI